MILISLIAGYLISRRGSIIQRLLKQCNCANIMMLGDSHIANGNWGDLLKRLDVLEIAQGGFTSAQMRFMYENYGRNFDAEICFIEVGGNDLHSGCYDRLQLIDNLWFIVNDLKSRQIKPVVQSLIYRYDFPSLNVEIDTLNRMMQKRAHREDIGFIDINSLLNDPPGYSENYHADRLHLSRKGYRIWRNGIKAWLEQWENED
jgi:lysophospholipase L1-like esterase